MDVGDGGAELQIFVGGVDVEDGVCASELCADSYGEIGGERNVGRPDGAGGFAGEIDAAAIDVDRGRDCAGFGQAQGHLQVIDPIVKAQHGNAVGQAALAFDRGAQICKRCTWPDASAGEEGVEAKGVLRRESVAQHR